MFKKSVSVISLFYIFISIYLTTFVSSISAYYTNMPASVVVGQPDFVSGSVNQGSSVSANTIKGTFGSLVVNNKLIVADYLNNRVLIYNSIPTSNNTAADVVIGQADFTHNSPDQGGSAAANTLDNPEGGLASDGTRLLIADSNNNRILVYNRIPTTNNASADVVIGQPNMTTVNGGSPTTAATLGYTLGVFYDTPTGKLIIPDWFQNRVLVFNQIPTANGASADVVVGQTDFISSSSIARPTAAGFLRALFAEVYDGKLFVSTSENRILVWNTIPTTNGVPADVVIGQPDFTHSSSNQGGSAAANTINTPYQVTSDGKRLFVIDSGNNRILVYNSIPTANNTSADMVIGQPNFTSTSANQGGSVAGNTLSTPGGVNIQGNQLFVADYLNNRLLIFNNVIDTPQMNINLPIEKLNNTTLRVKGSIQLGNRPNYSMQWVKSEINGNGLGYITSLGGGRDNGDNLTLYDFFNEFNPTVNGGTTTNYTMKLVASSFNADTTSLFYFQPFNFEYIRRTNPTLTLSKQSLNISFLVSKLNIQRMKDNIDHFEIQTSTDSAKTWKQLSTNISTDKISNEGQIYLTIPNTLIPGTKYLVKTVAISKDSNWRQDSNILTYFVPKKKVATKQ